MWHVVDDAPCAVVADGRQSRISVDGSVVIGLGLSPDVGATSDSASAHGTSRECE